MFSGWEIVKVIHFTFISDNGPILFSSSQHVLYVSSLFFVVSLVAQFKLFQYCIKWNKILH